MSSESCSSSDREQSSCKKLKLRRNVKKTQGFSSLSSKNDSSNSSDRDEIFPKKRNRRRAGITQRSNLSEQDVVIKIKIHRTPTENLFRAK